MTSTNDPLVGHVLDRRYHVVDRLARGGMATVYRAADTRLDRMVALKVMHVGLGDDEDFRRKFDREARAAARLSHPNVVSVFDQGDDGGRPYIVMELVEGTTLRSVISRQAPLAPLRALTMIEPVLSALAAAHEAGLVHRDIKPENVLISEQGRIKVGDFGLARAVTAQTSTATAGLLIGTVSYLPPELVVSGRADARSDVYSTGVVLFELLTGRKPHTGESPIQVAYAHVHKDVPPPSQYATAGPVPDYLDALVARATARNADARPHDARVMLAQVRRVRSALRSGITADPELTQDLTVPLAVLRAGLDGPDPRPAGPGLQPLGTSRLEQGPSTPDPVDPYAGTTALGPMLAAAAAEEEADRAEYTPTDIRFLSGPSTPRTPMSGPSPSPRPVPPNRPVHRSRHRGRGWIALLVVLLLTLTAAAAGWYYAKGRFTTAPALTSLPQTRAAAIADEAGLRVDFSRRFSETVPKGMVIDTKPRPGGKVLRGGLIDAVVSRGPERYPMPTVVGLSRSRAEQALTSGHLATGDVTDRHSETVAKGVVLSASADPGARLRPGTRVDLVVSAGRKPIPIQDFTGRAADRAGSRLRAAGFVVDLNRQHSATVAAGDVISQSPARGTGFAHDHITLVESLGPVMVTVPNVRSMGVQAATKTLQARGFTVRTQHSGVIYLGLGYVASSDPKGGTRAAEGSTVTLSLI